MEIMTVKENCDDDDASTKMSTTENVTPKEDKHFDFMERIKQFHGHKNQRQYNFKIVLKAMQDSPDVCLVQRFQLFLKKMVAVDPHFMILPWKENSDKKPITKPDQIPKTMGGLKQFFHRASPRP